MRLAKAAAAVALVIAGCCAPVARADPTPAPTPSPTPPPAPKNFIDHDGTYAVGTDILPGTYRSAGPVEKKVCYWKRVRGNEIIDNAMSKKPQIVQIEPTDTAFKTDRCQPWEMTECPPDCAPHPAPPGLPPDLRNFLPNGPLGPAPAPPVPPAPAHGPAPGPAPAGQP